jgi:predicted nucleic acid-binding protein
VTETPAEVVIDASAAIRGLVGSSEEGAGVVRAIIGGETSAHAPDLIVAEVTNALRQAVRVGGWGMRDAELALSVFLAWPLTIQACAPIAPAALTLALERQLSAYDALYATLAQALHVPLVTADRRLAGAVADSVLVE